MKPWLPLAALSLAVPGAAFAHHSFAAFFDPAKTITLKGTVTAFRFTNPHGTVVLSVPGSDGKAHVVTCQGILAGLTEMVLAADGAADVSTTPSIVPGPSFTTWKSSC